MAASGWNAELIPDDEILESQFPDVLKELRMNESRKEELEAVFKEVNDLEEGVWNEDDYEVWPKDELKELKEQLKALNVEIKEAKKEIKLIKQKIKAGASGLDEQLNNLETVLVSPLLEKAEGEALRIAKHTELEDELKQCKRVIREIKDRKQNLVDQARLLIPPEEAKELILKRWNNILHQTVDGYLQTHQRQLLLSVENLWEKYTTTLNSILIDREKETKLLNNFLTELGYE